MTKIATTKSMLSSVLLSDARSLVADFNYAQVNLKEAADTTVKLGQVVYYNGTDAYRILKNADFTSDTVLTAPSGTPSLPDRGAIGIVVGFNGSIGGEYEATVGTTAVKAFVLFRGPVGVKDTHSFGGIQFDAGISVQARKDLIKAQFEAKGIDIKPVTAQVTSSLYGF